MNKDIKDRLKEILVQIYKLITKDNLTFFNIYDKNNYDEPVRELLCECGDCSGKTINNKKCCSKKKLLNAPFDEKTRDLFLKKSLSLNRLVNDQKHVYHLRFFVLTGSDTLNEKFKSWYHCAHILYKKDCIAGVEDCSIFEDIVDHIVHIDLNNNSIISQLNSQDCLKPIADKKNFKKLYTYIAWVRACYPGTETIIQVPCPRAIETHDVPPFGLALGVKGVSVADDKIQKLYGLLLDIRDEMTAEFLTLYSGRLESSALDSALATIMTRNFSHNIGSHVLTYVTDAIDRLNVQDNRLLFEYVQARNDFLAQVASGFPGWSYPAWMGREVMAGFFSQKHLLNYIARSEGFHACEFQDGANSSGQGSEKKKELDLVFYYEDGREKHLILGCPEKGECCCNNHCKSGKKEGKESGEGGCGVSCLLDHDQRVAVPGGLVGYHAFYTIIENIIRNAAKYNPGAERNLRIEVHLQKDEEDPWAYQVTVTEHLTQKTQKKQDDDDDLVGIMNGKLRAPIIDSDGRLEPEDWGMKELKIAALYLGGGKIAKLAEKEKEGEQIITAGWHQCCDCAESLGFTFKMRRPRELLVVGVDRPGNDKLDTLNKHGIDVVKDVDSAKSLDFEMMLLVDSKIPKGRKRQCPVRLVRVTKEEWQKICDGSKCFSDDKKIVELKEKVYLRWIQCLAQKRGLDGEEVFLYVKTEGAESGKDKDKSILEEELERQLKKLAEKCKENGKCISHSKTKNKFIKGVKEVTGFGNRSSHHPPTLPRVISADDKGSWKGTNDIKFIKINPETQSPYAKSVYYNRHDICSGKPEALYRENLSGSALHAPIVMNLPREDWGRKRTIMQMVENGLLRIAVADERFLNHFLKVRESYKDEKGKYQDNENPLLAANILAVSRFCGLDLQNYEGEPACDDGQLSVTKLKDNTLAVVSNGGEEQPVEILIIHKTLFEKLKKSDEKAKEIITALEKKIPLVVVTSGRGGQRDAGVRFMPFAVLEHYLMGAGHSKMLAVTALLNARERQEGGE